MRPAAGQPERRDQLIGRLLWYGTALASALIAIGLLLNVLAPPQAAFGLPLSGYGVMKAGVAVFIALPVARVALMAILFLRERDYVHTVIAALVLAIIAAGVIVEV